MLEKRKRISKKEMKQDTLVTSYYKAYNFFFENQVKLLIGIGAVAVVVVAVVLFSNKRSNDNTIANTLLGKVIPTYDAGQFKEAIEGQKTTNTTGLKEIVDNYGSTEAGETAKIYLANAYYYTGNFEAALDLYEDYGGSSPLFKSASLSGRAACAENKKEFEKAAELYKDAANVSPVNPSNADDLLKAGINFLLAGKKEEAKSLLEMIKKDYRNSSVANEVDKYLIQIES